MNGATDDTQSEFHPIPDLFRPDGDIILAFLSGNGVTFLTKTEDDWYRGIVPETDYSYSGQADGNWTTKTFYRPDAAASPMGCLQQYQFCNPALPDAVKCGPLTGWMDAELGSAHLFGMTKEEFLDDDYVPSDEAPSQWLWLLYVLAQSGASLANVLETLQGQALASTAYLAEGMMAEIPYNQWQFDAMHWWATWLASIQAGVVDIAYGPTNPIYNPFRYEPFNSHVEQMCNSQVRRLCPLIVCIDSIQSIFKMRRLTLTHVRKS